MDAVGADDDVEDPARAVGQLDVHSAAALVERGDRDPDAARRRAAGQHLAEPAAVDPDERTDIAPQLVEVDVEEEAAIPIEERPTVDRGTSLPDGAGKTELTQGPHRIRLHRDATADRPPRRLVFYDRHLDRAGPHRRTEREPGDATAHNEDPHNAIERRRDRGNQDCEEPHPDYRELGRADATGRPRRAGAA